MVYIINKYLFYNTKPTKMNRPLLSLLLVLFITNKSSAQLSGNYTINNTQATAGTNYASFTDAINALNTQGVNTTTGATFRVSSGQTFSERPPVLTATGVAGAPIAFIKFGALANPVITPPTAGTIALGTAIGSLGGNGDAVVRIAGSDYVTFDGIDIGLNASFTTAAQYYEYGYMLLRASATDACRYVTIKNATINMQPLVQNAAGIYTSNLDATGATITATAVSGRGEGNVFRKNTILNAYNGVVLRGSTDATAPYDQFDHFNIIDSNSVQSFGGTTTECYGVYFINADSTLVTDNTVQSISTAANTYGIRPAASTSASVFIYRNTISLISTSGGIYGIDNSAGTTAANNTIDISYNKVINSSVSGTGSMYALRGQGSGATLIISNNEVANITNSGTGTTYLIYSIPSGGQTKSRVFQNHLHHVQNTNASNTTMYLHICNSALETHLYQNNIHDIVNMGTNGTILGRSNTANFFYYNNAVSRLFTPASASTDAIHALEINSGATNNKVFFNTIYLDSTSSAASYGNSCVYMGTNYDVELRNNILVNRSTPGSSTGYVCALRRSSTTLTSYNALSDNNCFYADTLQTRRVVFGDGTNFINIAGFKALVGPDRDSLSFFELPPFINVATAPYNLNITPEGSLCVDGGSNVSSPVSVTTDLLGNLRGSPPDIGAYETGVALPVEYINLQVIAAGSDAVLQWEVDADSKFSGFEVERSSDGKNFEKIAYVKPGEYGTAPDRYTKTDIEALHLNKDLYYRIKKINLNGKNTYSRIVKLAQNEAAMSAVTVWPNPFTAIPNLSFESASEGKAVLTVTDIKGNKMTERTITIQKGISTIQLSEFNNLKPGTYFARIIIGGRSMFAKLVKND